MVTVRKQDDSLEFNSYKLAIAVLAERVRSLPQADKDDLFELTKILFSDASDEEKQSAMVAMDEIIEQQPIALVRIEENANDSEQLNKWMHYISNKIKHARQQAGITQEQLAERTGLAQSHISRLESGVHSPSNATIKKIAAALNLKPSDLDPSSEP